MPDTHRFVGQHPEDLANGRVLAPGEAVKLTDQDTQDDHNKRLIDEGRLIALDDGKSKSKKEGR
jgi:hypothetical protein